MPAQLATLVFFGIIAGLWWLDRDKTIRTSKALWIVFFWMLMNGSRPVSFWLELFGIGSGAPVILSPDQYLDGSPLDRNVFMTMLFLSFAVIVSSARRRQKAAEYLRKNGLLLLFVAYCAVSVVWSDYPFVAFKRWTKSLGDILIVLVILTEAEPFKALRVLMARVAFILMPISVLFIKYYPELGRSYNRWTYLPTYGGITENKNELGVICLIFGLGCVWSILYAWKEKTGSERYRRVFAHVVVLTMIAWLLHMADSMTSISCLAMASGLMAVTSTFKFARKPVIATLMVLVMVCVPAFALFAKGGGALVGSLGRDPTLTGRTDFWQAFLSVSGNPLVGTGYESFWLGARLQKIWELTMPFIQEAHNGYLEIYLNLGWIGVSLLACLIAMGYRRIISALRTDTKEGCLRLALYAGGLVYNFTEAGFREATLMWLFFLFCITAVPLGNYVRKIRRTEEFSPLLAPLHKAEV